MCRVHGWIGLVHGKARIRPSLFCMCRVHGWSGLLNGRGDLVFFSGGGFCFVSRMSDRTNLEHISQSGPYSGLGFQVEVTKNSEVVPSSLESGSTFKEVSLRSDSVYDGCFFYVHSSWLHNLTVAYDPFIKSQLA